MSSRIQTNMEALNAYRNLMVTNRHMSRSMERLSSGFRINRAADDAAGLAISEQMRGQIRGLDQAVSNAQDATSLIQTAEGSLNEIHEILQRVRELAVQSANDTLTEGNRAEVQAEVDQLSLEITRIAETTEFNTMNLLDGSFTNALFQIGANEGQNIELSIDNMSADVLGIAGDGGATFQISGTGAISGSITAGSFAAVSGYQETTVVDFGEDVIISGEGHAVYRYGLENEEGDIVAVAGKFDSDNESHTYYFLEEAVAREDLWSEASFAADHGDNTLIFDDPVTSGTVAFDVDFGSDAITDVVAYTTLDVEGLETGTYSMLTGAAAIQTLFDDQGIAYADGEGAAEFAGLTGAQDVVVGALTDDNGDIVAVAFDVDTDGNVVAAGADGSATNEIQWFGIDNVDLEYTDDAELDNIVNADPLWTQNSSFEDGREVQVRGEGGIDVSSQAAADRAIGAFDEAIEMVSRQRSLLGAVQNRLEHTVENLRVASENLQAAESRIRDVDMAAEMAEFSKQQILEQAGVAMLAQANMAPQSVLQLLG